MVQGPGYVSVLDFYWRFVNLLVNFAENIQSVNSKEWFDVLGAKFGPRFERAGRYWSPHLAYALLNPIIRQMKDEFIGKDH